jgi:glycosyltransferase involved in cell wall biosynthesis
VRARVESLGVTDRVHFLGYVSDAEMASLYSNASALVMASYFGPTNIPPLEGFQLSVPVIASSIHQDQLQDGALYFDPDDEETLTQAMLEVQTPRTREKLIAAGTRRLNSLAKERHVGEEALLDLISRLSKRIL